ncbi:MAG: acetyl-CoA carboxylase, biotin carboxyl carrier protein [bacterium]|nr:acetyl-CoA carboxylase, biotin carboxyl carrier protein [bacterium]
MANKDKKPNDRKLKEVIKLLSEHNLIEIDIKEGKDRIRVKRNIKKNFTTKKAGIVTKNTQHKEKEEKYKEVKSPLVGTVYCAPFPGAIPFVEEGGFVKKGQTVAIVEAMKLFNEIKSEFEGKIAKVLIKEGQSVEVDQTLFLIE